MSKPYLEITYRHGKPFAAYLYLSRRAGDQAARSVRRGSLVIDYAADGRSIGIEMPSVTPAIQSELQEVLADLKDLSISAAELMPLKAG